MPFYSNANSLQLTRKGVIQHIYPLQGNEAAIGHDIFSDPKINYEARIARNSAQLTLTGPLELVQGGQAVIGRLPIYMQDMEYENDFWGFSVALIRVPELLNSIELYSLEQQGYNYKLYRFHPETRQQQVIAQSNRAVTEGAEQLSIFIPGAEWKLDVEPKTGWLFATSLLFQGLIAVFFSLFLTTSFASIIQQRKDSQFLESLVINRTKDLDEHLKRLQLSFRTANQRSFDLNVQTGELQINNEYSNKFGFSPESHCLSIEQWQQNIHPDDLAKVINAYKKCIRAGGSQSVEFRERAKGSTWSWIYATGEVIERDSTGQASRIIGVFTDISRRKQDEQVLRALAETKSRSSPQDDIFKVIVKQLALAYDMHYALISVIDEEKENTARTVAVCGGDDYLDNMSYSLIGTPCANVLEHDTGICQYPCDIQNQFPLDKLLVDMDAKSYIGMALHDSNDNTIGLIALIDTRKRDLETIPPLDLMKSLAVRAGNEIERQNADSRLTLSSRVFEQAREGIIITDANANIIDINPTFSEITGYSLKDVQGTPPSILSSGRQNAEFYEQMWQSIDDEGFWQGEIWNRRKNGELYAELLTISSLKDENDEVLNYVGLFSDVTHSKEQQQKLELIAHYDILTKLPNRTLFADRFDHAVAHSQRNNTQLAICFLDLDNFKPVNDTYGHDVGDMVLIEMANRIKANIRKQDTLSRQGGDEFALLLEDLESIEQSKETLDRILNSLSKPYSYDDHIFQISASVGVTLYPDDSSDLDTLLRHADQAMYKAKMAGKNQYQFFNTRQNEKLLLKQSRLDEIKQALADNEFCLYYQPKVNMKTGEAIGLEALIRWQHPEKGLIPPLEFLPLIDGNVLEIKLGQWVIEQAINQLDKWQQQGFNIEISINISSYHLLSASFLPHLKQTIQSCSNVDPRRLQLEVLESSTLSDLKTITAIIQSCQSELGIEFALDDFGTSYSSLTHLRNLPAGTIKIDQSFVRDMLEDPNDYAIVEGVIRLAKTFNRHVIAEGVETTGHGLMLLLMDCKQAQGFGISKPLPADQVVDWFNNRYQPNQHWIECGQQTFTTQQREIKLFKLGVDSWLERCKTNILSSPPVFDWSSLDSSQCYCKKWIVRARQESLFVSDVLDKLEQQHEEMHDTAQAIIEQVRENHVEPSEELFIPLEKIVKQMYATVDSACQT